MKIELQKPYSDDWDNGYLVVNPESRKTVILTKNKSRIKSSVSYARYLVAVKMGRYLTKDEEVDHIDEDKTNDSVVNLQILSKRANLQKNGMARRKPLVHGSLSAYRYCRCEKCKLGKRLYRSGDIDGYRKLIS